MFYLYFLSTQMIWYWIVPTVKYCPRLQCGLRHSGPKMAGIVHRLTKRTVRVSEFNTSEMLIVLLIQPYHHKKFFIIKWWHRMHRMLPVYDHKGYGIMPVRACGGCGQNVVETPPAQERLPYIRHRTYALYGVQCSPLARFISNHTMQW